MCQQLDYHYESIGNYLQTFNPGIGWSCTCKGYRYRKTCKHVAQAEKEQCTWHKEYSDEKQVEEGVCPVCGGPTIPVMVGV